MSLRHFSPGMVVEALFRFPGDAVGRAGTTDCVVMAVHPKGILLHPIVRQVPAISRHSVATARGRVLCDIRNIVEMPAGYVVAQRSGKGGEIGFGKGKVTPNEFEAIKAASLDCAYGGHMRSERLHADPAAIDALVRREGIRAFQRPSVMEMESPAGGQPAR